MEVKLTPEQEGFVRHAIASGRLRHEEDALQEALALWEVRERNRVEILTAFDEAESDLESGCFSDYDDASHSLVAGELKREARVLGGNGSNG